MRVTDRYELAADLSQEYRTLPKVERGKLLDAFCLATGYHRKHAAAVLSGRQRRKVAESRQRPRRYGEAFRTVLAVLWEASGYVCAERLQPWSVELLSLLERHGDISVSDDVRQLLGKASVSTVERTLHELRCKEVGRRMCQTKPGTLLRRQIPVIVGHWKDLDEPGYVEIDLVSHSGECPVGRFLYTLCVVDICTGWTERVPVLGKHQEGIRDAMDRVRYLLPFELKGIHPDNGTEFINALMFKWCQDNDIIFSRGRPYRKNDNPHVEQKNWTLVRRLIGYERMDTAAEQAWLDALYTDLLRPFANCFQPVMKLLEKVQVNNHTRRKYDVPMTPLQRVINSKAADPHKLKRLTELYEGVSPLRLKRQIDAALASKPIPTEEALSA